MNALELFPRQSGASLWFSPLRKPSLRAAPQLALAGITLAAIFAVVAPAGLDQVSAQDIERQDEAPEEGVTGQADECPSGSSLPRCQPASPPVISSIAATGHRITANYRTSTWARTHVHYYKFEIHRATSRNGSYTLADTNRFESFSPVEFPHLARGYWYKIRGTRCSSRLRSDCGPWSAWSSSVERPALVTSSQGPPAPSGLALSKYGSGADDLRARYTPSQWSGSAVHRYRFEIHRKVGNKWNFQKIEHTQSGAFVECQVPTIASSPQTTKTGSRVQVTWTYAPGCVSGVTADYYRFCWQTNGRSRRPPARTATVDNCVKVEGGTTRSYTYKVPSTFSSWNSVTLQTTEIRPDDIAYGGPRGFETLLGNRQLDFLFNGAYYDKQTWNITTEAE